MPAVISLSRQLFLWACLLMADGTAYAIPLVSSDIATPHPITRQLAAAEQLTGQGQAQEALEVLDLILADYPDDRRTLYTKARLLALEGRLDASQDIIDTLLRDDPPAALVLHLQGFILSRRGQWAEALAYYKEAYQAGHDRYFMNTMTQAYLIVEGPDATFEFLTAHLEQYPREHNIRLARAKLYQRERRYRDAERDYEQLMAELPDNPAAWKNMADLLLEQRDRRALAHAREAARLAPGVPEVMHTLGQALMAFGEPEEALRVLAAAHRARRSDAAIAYDYALALADNDARDQALEIMTALAALDAPVGVQARRFLERANP